MPARVRLAVATLAAPLLVVYLDAIAAIRADGGRVRMRSGPAQICPGRRVVRAVIASMSSGGFAGLGREPHTAPRRDVAIDVLNAVHRQRVLRAGRQCTMRGDEHERSLLGDHERRRFHAVRPVKRDRRRGDALELQGLREAQREHRFERDPVGTVQGQRAGNLRRLARQRRSRGDVHRAEAVMLRIEDLTTGDERSGRVAPAPEHHRAVGQQRRRMLDARLR